MKISFFLFHFMFFVIVNANAQQKMDTLFFDEGWEVSEKENAAYYRILTWKNPMFHVENYYINRKIQMIGTLEGINPEVKEGKFQYFRSDGSLEHEGTYTSDKKNGIFKYYYPEGNVESEGKYIDDYKEGIWTYYYNSGEKWLLRSFSLGEFHGESTTYYSNGKIKRLENFKFGNLKTGKCFSISGSDTTYYPFEEMPSFKSGLDEMMKYIQTNLKYPPDAMQHSAEGKVLITFTINSLGKIENAYVSKGIHPSLDYPALQVVTNMPDWIPGKRDGVPVSVKYTIPINFKFTR